MLQARMSESDQRLYSPNRDVAHNFGEILRTVLERSHARPWTDLNAIADAAGVDDAAATDYLGHPTTIDANDAARWCISGAIHIAYRHNPVLAQKTIYEATRALQANARELNEGIQTLQRWIAPIYRHWKRRSVFVSE